MSNRMEQTTVANSETNARLAPINPKTPLVLGPIVAGVLALLSVAAGSVAAAAMAFPGVLPVGVVIGALITGSLTSAGAYFARGAAVPQDLLDSAVANLRAVGKKA